MEPNRPNIELWPREVDLPLMADSTGKRIFLIGGRGNPSGREKDGPILGRTNFDGQFYLLDDIWELDLEHNSWRRLLPCGKLNAPRLRAAVYHPELRGLLIFQGTLTEDPKPKPAAVLLFRPDKDPSPVKLPVEGEVSSLYGSRDLRTWWTLDPHNDILLLTTDGIFRVSIQTS